MSLSRSDQPLASPAEEILRAIEWARAAVLEQGELDRMSTTAARLIEHDIPLLIANLRRRLDPSTRQGGAEQLEPDLVPLRRAG